MSDLTDDKKWRLVMDFLNAVANRAGTPFCSIEDMQDSHREMQLYMAALLEAMGASESLVQRALTYDT